MGLLDDLKSKANDAIAGATGRLGSLASTGKGKKQAEPPVSGMDAINAALAQGEAGGSAFEDSGHSGDFEGDDEYDDILNDAIKPQRSDILDLLGIPDNYEVPDDVLLAGDLDRVRFDRSTPVGYSEPMVDAFFSTVYDSLIWYRDTLKKRNRDIAKLATQLDKSATDLHNAKINAEMSDGLTVMTGQESTAEQEMQKLQLAVIKLRDENDKLKKQLKAVGGAASNVPDSRYDDLQNQLGLAQLEIKKLTAQLKRQSFETASEDEGGLDLAPVMSVQGAPGAGEAPVVPAQVPNPFDGQPGDGPAMPGPGVPAMPGPDDAIPGPGDAMLGPGDAMPSLPGGGEMGLPDPMPGPDQASGVMSAPNVTRSNLTGIGTMGFSGRANEGYSSPEKSAFTAAAADDDFDVDLSANGLQGGAPAAPALDYQSPLDVSAPADMPVPDPGFLDAGDDAFAAGPPMPADDASPIGGGKTPSGHGSTEPAGMPDISSDEFLPLPDSMTPDAYDDLGIDLDDGSGEIDMTKML